MGEYAEDALRQQMRRGLPMTKHDGRRSPVGGKCPIYGKGVRTIAGRLDASMAQHMKDKHS